MEHDARRRLEDVLDREIDVARALAATLAAERAALTGDSPQAVEHAAAEKIRSADPRWWSTQSRGLLPMIGHASPAIILAI